MKYTIVIEISYQILYSTNVLLLGCNDTEIHNTSIKRHKYVFKCNGNSIWKISNITLHIEWINLRYSTKANMCC